MDEETRECYWCKVYGKCTPEEYTFPIDWPGGICADTRNWICDACCDSADPVKESPDEPN